MIMCIPGNRFINKKCLVYENSSYYWSDFVPENSIVLGSPSHHLSLDSMFQIFDKKAPKILEDKVVNSYVALGVDPEEIPVDAVQSSSLAISKIKSAFEEAERVISALETKGYIETYIKCNRTLDIIESARFNAKKFREDIKSGKVKNVSVAKTFKVDNNGYLQKTKYSTSKTITGRMTVNSGPQILTAPKYYRKYIDSAYDGGKIFQLDFVSLEPRVGIHTKKPESERDIYSFLMRNIFSEKIPRSLMKKIVLCSMYGASEATIREEIPKGYSPKRVIEKTREYLNFKNVVLAQKENIREFGFIKNYFGRPIYPQDSRDAIIFNNYIQSSAVDISLLGFKKILDRVSNLDVKPLFFIHDALIFDVHPSSIDKFKEVSKIVEIKNLGKFPLEISILDDN